MIHGDCVKKPVKVDWFQWKGNKEDLVTWLSKFGDSFSEHFISDKNALNVKTLEGTSYAVPLDAVIIRGVRGEYYPIDFKIFIETYFLSVEGPPSDCYKCTHKLGVPGSAHSSCKADWSELPKPKFDEHGIKNGWVIFPMNFDPVWMTSPCLNFNSK